MEIKVCKKIELKGINEIRPYWRNPRRNDETVAALKKIIPEVGFNVPISIDEEGVIIKGHARYRAACQLGMKEVPCIVSDNTEEQNRLDRVADNKISELAEWDTDVLQNEVDSIDFDFSQIGMDVGGKVEEPEEFDVEASSFAAIKRQTEDTDLVKRFNVVNAKCPKCGNPMEIRLE